MLGCGDDSPEAPSTTTAAPADAAGDDDHLYVVEPCGAVLRVGPDGGDARTFLDLSGTHAAGHVYATSLEGSVYRLDRQGSS